MLVDGFNVYYGARYHCGHGAPGWRWLDIRGLVADVLPAAWRSNGATIERGVGGHWWERLTAATYTAHQLPNPVGKICKPYSW